MKTIVMVAKERFVWLAMTAFTVAAYFGFRCPAPGCPCCKAVGK